MLVCPYCDKAVTLVVRNDEDNEFKVFGQEKPVLRIYLERYIARPCGHELELMYDNGVLTILKRGST